MCVSRAGPAAAAPRDRVELPSAESGSTVLPLHHRGRACPEGVEPPTSSLACWRSAPLSYGHSPWMVHAAHPGGPTGFEPAWRDSRPGIVTAVRCQPLVATAIATPPPP